MCKVYSKEIGITVERSRQKRHINDVKNQIPIKNKNHNTCSGTAFIKP